MRVLCLNHKDELDRSTLDLYSRQKRQIRMFQLQRRTRQHSTDRYVARRTWYCMHECMRAIYSASSLYLYIGLRKPKERMKFDLSEKATRSF